MRDFSTITALENPSKGLLDPSEAFDAEAKEHWDYLRAGRCDVVEGVDILFSKYSTFELEPFTTTKRQKKRRCFELLRSDARMPDHRCGPLGRLLMMVGPGNLWFHTLHMVDLGLDELEHDPASLFDRHKLKRINKALKKLVSGPWLAVVEIAPDSGCVHVHLLAARTSIPSGLGRRSKVKNLLRAAMYICKKPPKTRENVVAYVKTVRDSPPGRRQMVSGLTRKTRIDELEVLLDLYVLQPKRQRWSILAETRRTAPSVPKPKIISFSLPGLPQFGSEPTENDETVRHPHRVDTVASVASLLRTARSPSI